ncbi:MAG: SocA family protein, partial [Acidobacteriia bacterium]|nr:SocA family protein [Terriglobia bacterium]
LGLAAVSGGELPQKMISAATLPIYVGLARCLTIVMMATVLRFNERRATEAAARFLKLRGGRMSYLKLIKLLYLLDRETLLRWGRPVTTDRYVSMDNGPVVSRIYDLIREERAPGTDPIWRHYISAPQEWEVALLADLETDELSRAEEALIDEIYAAYGKMTRWDLVRVSHDLPEWQDPNGSAIPIQYRDILRAGNKTETEVAAVEAELESLAATEAMLQPA